jgi:hypothetical protein
MGMPAVGGEFVGGTNTDELVPATMAADRRKIS